MIEHLIILAVLGLAFYLIENYLTIAEPFKVVIRFVMILVLIIWLLNFFGVTDYKFGS